MCVYLLLQEIGFEVSQVLEADTPGEKAGTQKQSDFGFSKLFSHSTTASQLASSGKRSGVYKRLTGKGSCNVRMKGKAKHKQPQAGSKRKAATTEPKMAKRDKKKTSAKSATKSKSVMVLKGNNQSSREQTQPVKKQKRVVPKSLRKQNRKNHSVNTRGSKKNLSTVAATDYDDPASNMDTYPLCVLTQLSVGACSGSSQTNPSAYIDISVPKDILIAQPS